MTFYFFQLSASPLRAFFVLEYVFIVQTIKVKFYWVQNHKNRIERKDKLSVQREHTHTHHTSHLSRKRVLVIAAETFASISEIAIVFNRRPVVQMTVWHNCIFFFVCVLFRWMRVGPSYWITGKITYLFIHIFSSEFLCPHLLRMLFFLQNGETQNM